MRLFFAWPGVTLNAEGLADYRFARTMWDENSRYSTRREQWAAVRTCLRDAARMAEDAGVTLALQNHGPLLRHYRDMLDMIAEVDSPALQACLDVPILERQDVAYVEQAVRETGRKQVPSHFGGEYERAESGAVRQRQFEFDRPPTNYPAFIGTLKETGYDGYFCYEYCHPAQNERHETQGLEFVEKQTRLAFAYLRDLLVAEGAYTGRAGSTG